MGCSQSASLAGMKRMVSKQKKRFQEDGFDLDLTYITGRIIAMGFPSEGMEAAYRNSMAHVQAFFERRHAGHFRVFNLCSERSYSPLAFGQPSRVEKIGFADHNACPLWMIDRFCTSVEGFLNEDKENVVAVHCKAGKGRTGLMISSYLLLTGQYENAEDALRFFGERRTHNGKGVTIPSQRRFVSYYERVVHKKMTFPIESPQLMLKHVWMSVAPNFTSRGGGCTPYIKVYQHVGDGVFQQTYSSREKAQKPNAHADAGQPVRLEFEHNAVLVEADTKIELYDMDFFKDQMMCAFWFHTGFLSETPPPPGEVLRLSFPKAELDKACKYKDRSPASPFPENFRVELEFTVYDPWQPPPGEVQQKPVLKGSLSRSLSTEEALSVDTVLLRGESVYHSVRSSLRRGSTEELRWTSTNPRPKAQSEFTELQPIDSDHTLPDDEQQWMTITESAFTSKTRSARWWMQRLFDAYDPHGDGLIDESELLQILARCGHESKQDKDAVESVCCGDGTIVFPEFFSFMLDKLNLPVDDGQLTKEQTIWLAAVYQSALTEQAKMTGINEEADDEAMIMELVDTITRDVV